VNPGVSTQEPTVAQQLTGLVQDASSCCGKKWRWRHTNSDLHSGPLYTR
jgi:hypothetical protein